LLVLGSAVASAAIRRASRRKYLEADNEALSVAREGACAPEEIIFAAQEIVWTIRGFILTAATTSATAEEIISAAAQVVFAIAEVPATAGTTSSTVERVILAVAEVILTAARVIFAADWLFLMAKTIVLRAATAPEIRAKALETKGKTPKIAKCCVLLTTNSCPPMPKVDKLF
jgi:hypothetical protein